MPFSPQRQREEFLLQTQDKLTANENLGEAFYSTNPLQYNVCDARRLRFAKMFKLNFTPKH